jgi:hypothetical protein
MGIIRKVRIKNIQRVVSYTSTLILVVAVVCWITNYSNRKLDIDTGYVRDSVRTALVHCYALEGSYPSSISHLVQYGVVLDYDKYIYYYDVFASNIMPDVVIVQK